MTSHEPLHIRAWLRGGVIADDHLPLDGILMYQVCRDRFEPQILTAPGDALTISEALPLARGGAGEYWYWRCSWAQWPDHTREALDSWNKRLDSAMLDLAGFAGKVEIGKGRYKSYHQSVVYRSALWIDWYALGDAKRIWELLNTVTHVGKKSAQGWGRVTRWEIEYAAEDYSVWRAGQLMRGVPPVEAPGWPIGQYGIRPPYWYRLNQMLLAVPEFQEIKRL
jgi:hypothetical protein